MRAIQKHKSDGFSVIEGRLISKNANFEIEFESVVGSIAYGTNVAGSDIDIKGIFVQPLEHRLLYGRIEQIEINNDTTYFELNKFMSLISTGNPTMLELIFMPERCIRIISEKFRGTFYDDKIRKKFLTKHCKRSFCGYAMMQIKKAGGLNKLMNFEAEGYYSVEKDILDFCYVPIIEEGKTIPVKEYLAQQNYEFAQNQKNYGLSKANNAVNTYFAYLFNPLDTVEIPRGMIKETSNELRVSKIPKSLSAQFIITYNLGAYKEHQKKHKQYKTWLKERNTQRYVDSSTHGQKIDGKNLLHCVRLIDTAREIAAEGFLNVERANAKELIEIRKGKVNLSKLLEKAKIDIVEVEKLFEESNLKQNVPPTLVRNIKRDFYLSKNTKINKNA